MKRKTHKSNEIWSFNKVFKRKIIPYNQIDYSQENLNSFGNFDILDLLEYPNTLLNDISKDISENKPEDDFNISDGLNYTGINDLDLSPLENDPILNYQDLFNPMGKSLNLEYDMGNNCPIYGNDINEDDISLPESDYNKSESDYNKSEIVNNDCCERTIEIDGCLTNTTIPKFDSHNSMMDKSNDSSSGNVINTLLTKYNERKECKFCHTGNLCTLSLRTEINESSICCIGYDKNDYICLYCAIRKNIANFTDKEQRYKKNYMNEGMKKCSRCHAIKDKWTFCRLKFNKEVPFYDEQGYCNFCSLKKKIDKIKKEI